LIKKSRQGFFPGGFFVPSIEEPPCFFAGLRIFSQIGEIIGVISGK